MNSQQVEGSVPVENPFQSPSTESLEARPRPSEFRCGVPWLMLGSLIGLLVEVFYLYEWSILLESPFLEMVPHFVMDLCQAAIVGPGLVLFAFAWRGKRWTALSPGHWLWIAESGFVVGKLACALGVATGVLNEETGTLGVQTMLEYGLANVLGLAFMIFVLRRLLQTRAWRTVAWISLAFYVLGLVSSLLAISYYDGMFPGLIGLGLITGMLHRLWALAVVLMVIAAASDDMLRRHPRDTVHYAGLLVPLYVAGAPILYLFL